MLLSDTDWAKLIAYAGYQSVYPKGHILIKAGSTNHMLFRIELGKAIIKNPDDEIFLEVQQSGLCGLCIFDINERFLANSTVVVESDEIKVSVLDYGKIDNFLISDVDMARKFYFTLARQMSTSLLILRTLNALKFPKQSLIGTITKGESLHSPRNDTIKITEEFKISKDEVVIQEYKCQLTEGMGTKHDGILYVTGEHILFLGKVFSLKKKICIKIADIVQLTLKKKVIQIDIERGNCLIFNLDLSAFKFLYGIWEQSKQIYKKKKTCFFTYGIFYSC